MFSLGCLIARVYFLLRICCPIFACPFLCSQQAKLLLKTVHQLPGHDQDKHFLELTPHWLKIVPFLGRSQFADMTTWPGLSDLMLSCCDFRCVGCPSGSKCYMSGFPALTTSQANSKPQYLKQYANSPLTAPPPQFGCVFLMASLLGLVRKGKPKGDQPFRGPIVRQPHLAAAQKNGTQKGPANGTVD